MVTQGQHRSGRRRGRTMPDVRFAAMLVLALVAALGCADDGPDPIDPASSAPPVATDDDLLGAAVAIRVTACRAIVERGTGLVVEPGRVLTSAHVVAGATAIRVFSAAGQVAEARVIAFDPANDLAVLEVPPGLGRPLPLAPDPPAGAFDGRVVVFRQDVPVIETVEITRRVTLETEDIYRGAPVSRPGYELRADVRHGDSGGVIVRGGEAVAVVWSRSRLAGDRAWAVDPIRGGAEVRRQLELGSIDPGVDLGRCA